MIPDFNKAVRNDQGFWNLPPGIHEARWGLFCKRFGFSRRRIRMIGNMQPMFLGLRDAGCKFVKIDGSFVTSKPNPNDFDGTWDPEGVDETMLDQCIDDMDGDLMYDKYMGELYPQDAIEMGSGKSFDDFFQVDRFNNFKGIVKINLGTLP